MRARPEAKAAATYALSRIPQVRRRR